VSTDEGRTLRRRIELGVAISATGHATDLEEVGRFLGEAPAEVARDLEAYRAIRSAAVADGRTGMPDVP
jgi:hypothetical protein